MRKLVHETWNEFIGMRLTGPILKNGIKLRAEYCAFLTQTRLNCIHNIETFWILTLGKIVRTTPKSVFTKSSSICFDTTHIAKVTSPLSTALISRFLIPVPPLIIPPLAAAVPLPPPWLWPPMPGMDYIIK
jgi:hypothetical protein